MFSFTSGLFDSLFARVSAFKVFGFSGIIWAFRKFGFFPFRKFGFFRDSSFCIRGDNLALMTAGRGGGGGRGGEANNVLCLAFLASGLFQDILSMSPWLSVALASVLVLRVARWPLPSALRRFSEFQYCDIEDHLFAACLHSSDFVSVGDFAGLLFPVCVPCRCCVNFHTLRSTLLGQRFSKTPGAEDYPGYG